MIFSFTGFSQIQAFKDPKSKPKLGEVHYGNRVGGLIGQEGLNQELIFLAHEKDQLKKIFIALNSEKNIVKAIRFMVEMRDGSLKTFDFGFANNNEYLFQYELKKNQKLIGIKGSGGWFIDNLGFIFSDGKETQIWGGKGGDNTFRISLSKDVRGILKGRLMGVYGSYTEHLESLGLIFWPIE
jgi:hypothetical protein